MTIRSLREDVKEIVPFSLSREIKKQYDSFTCARVTHFLKAQFVYYTKYRSYYTSTVLVLIRQFK